MYIIKNAMQNLARNKGRNLMVGAIIFVIIVSVVTALMINNTADGVINDYKARFGSEVRLSPNLQRIQEEAIRNSSGGGMRMSMPQLAAEDYVRFGQSDLLQKVDYSASTNANASSLEAVNKDKGPGGGAMRVFVGAPVGSNPTSDSQDDPEAHQFYHRLTTNYSEFQDGTRQLDDSFDTDDLQSRFPENNNECILSSDLMKLNGMKLGDTFTVTSELMETGEEGMMYTDISWSMTVVGVFSDITQTDDQLDNLRNAWEDKRNEILTTFDTIVSELQDGKTGIMVSATYYLKEPEMLEAYEEEIRALGLGDTWDVTTDSASYNRVVKPVEGLKGVSLAFVVIVLIFGAIILALLSSIAIRERKYEIGVLRAMGMKKLKVVAGLWTETLAITAVCLILGLSLGVLAAQPVTNILYEQQLAAVEDSTPGAVMYGGPGGGASGVIAGGPVTSSMGGMRLPGMSAEEPLQDFDVSLNLITILEIIGIALLLSSLAGIISISKITKYEPIKILMERN